MKIGFYAHDVGPANMLEQVAEIAKSMWHEVVVVPKQKPGIWREYLGELKTCDVVCGCFSSFKIEGDKKVLITDEAEMVDALPVNKKLGCAPFVLIEDLPYMSLRPAAQEVLEGKALAAAIVAVPEQVSITEQGGVSYKDVAYLGPPVHWWPSYEQMVLGPSVVFQKKRGNERGFVRTQDKSIFSLGGKDPFRDLAVLERIVKSGKEAFGDEFVLVYKTHPGEVNFRKESPAGYDKRDAFLREQNVWMAEIDPSWTVPQLIRSSTITIFSGGNTDSVTAAYARMPGIYLYDDEVRENLAAHGMPNGHWFVAEMGGLLKVENEDELRVAMRTLAIPDGREVLRASQEKAFPLPHDWYTASKIIHYLEGLGLFA